MVLAWSDSIKCFSVFRHSFYLVLGFAKFSVSLFNISFLFTNFHSFYFKKKTVYMLILQAFLYLLYSLLFFLTSFVERVVDQAGSVVRVFINLLGTCLLARVVILLVTFYA